jgi:hypothetical protein
MVIWLRIIIISQKQLAEVISGIDIISFANKILYFTSFRASYIGGNFLKNEYFKISLQKATVQVLQSEHGRAEGHSL